MSEATDDPRADLKRQAGELAAAEVEPGMAIGLGTGSTAIFATRRIAERHRAGELDGIEAWATSDHVWREAEALGIPMLSPDLPRPLDLTIDGADEVDPAFNLIKGGGGALLREKIAAQASRRELIVVDDSKLSPQLGTRHDLPVEVLAHGWGSQSRFVESLGGHPVLRRRDGGEPYTTDNGNLVLDCRFGPVADLEGLAAALSGRAGVVEHGLFLGLATEVIVAGDDGIRRLHP